MLYKSRKSGVIYDMIVVASRLLSVIIQHKCSYACMSREKLSTRSFQGHTRCSR